LSYDFCSIGRRKEIRRASQNNSCISRSAKGGKPVFACSFHTGIIAHHTEKNGDAIVKRYVDRLKSTRSDDFAGALFETYAAAAFLKAGFTLAFENEQDGSLSHVEFIAHYPRTGNRFSVEVKARDRGTSVAGAADVDDVKRLRVANKLNKALGKKAAHTRVVMIEINVPDVVTSF